MSDHNKGIDPDEDLGKRKCVWGTRDKSSILFAWPTATGNSMSASIRYKDPKPLSVRSRRHLSASPPLPESLRESAAKADPEVIEADAVSPLVKGTVICPPGGTYSQVYISENSSPVRKVESSPSTSILFLFARFIALC